MANQIDVASVYRTGAGKYPPLPCVVRDHRSNGHYKGSGQVWQGRFKAFSIQSDEHYLTVLRYVERSALRANMVQRSQDWEWSSPKPIGRSGPAGLLHDDPILRPGQWTCQANRAKVEAELKALRQGLARGTPFGDTHWQRKTGLLFVTMVNRAGVECLFLAAGTGKLSELLSKELTCPSCVLQR